MKFIILILILSLFIGCNPLGYVVTSFPNCKRVKKGSYVHKDGYWVADREFFWLIRKASEK